jgi:hypothetical protein
MNNVTDFFFDERTFVARRLRSDEIPEMPISVSLVHSAERDAEFPEDLFKMTMLLAFFHTLGASAI